MSDVDLPTVLYAASEPQFCEVIEQATSSLGLRMLLATMGKMVPRLADESPSAIVMESLLSGPYLEVCRQLKANPAATRAIPVVLLASHPRAEENFSLLAERPAEAVIPQPRVQQQLPLTLREILIRQRRQTAFRQGIFSAERVLDQLAGGVVLLNQEGQIVYHNAGFLRLLTPAAEACVGHRLWDFLPRPAGSELLTQEGFLRPLANPMQWECQTEQGWFEARCRTLFSAGKEPEGWLLELRDISQQKQEFARQETASQSERDVLQAEITRLLAQREVDSVPGENRRLQESLPESFRQLSAAYREVLERSLEARNYKTSYNRSEFLRQLGVQLGQLQANPRDVIDLHSAALKHLLANADAGRGPAYADEARLTVVELMGYLATYYRASSNGMPSRPSTPPWQEKDGCV